MDPTSRKEPTEAGCAATELSTSALSASANELRNRIFMDCLARSFLAPMYCACQSHEYEELVYREFPEVPGEGVGLKTRPAVAETSASLGNRGRKCCSDGKEADKFIIRLVCGISINETAKLPIEGIVIQWD
jgi:hypothetical protein